MTTSTMTRRIARPERELRIKLTRASRTIIRHGRCGNAACRLIHTFIDRAPQAR